MCNHFQIFMHLTTFALVYFITKTYLQKMWHEKSWCCWYSPQFHLRFFILLDTAFITPIMCIQIKDPRLNRMPGKLIVLTDMLGHHNVSVLCQENNNKYKVSNLLVNKIIYSNNFHHFELKFHFQCILKIKTEKW